MEHLFRYHMGRSLKALQDELDKRELTPKQRAGVAREMAYMLDIARAYQNDRYMRARERRDG